nr:uncharacterized protein CI109_002582 [Kwoniella shandongensis]KAA5529240.1 hypothetical protein CI109_002582 [Kwoniella shandongensis]
MSAFHLQGSRILSRSFTVPLSRFTEIANDNDSVWSDDEEEQIAVMIPFADMLNAAFERDNAHLFADEELPSDRKEGFTMKSTKRISPSEQIYNTYDSPPNSELLRKYGHVDVLPLPADLVDLLDSSDVGEWPYGNAGDEVLIDGNHVVEAVAAVLGEKADDAWRKSVQKRVDWWLEEDQDDMFPLALSRELDTSIIAFIRLLSNDDEWLRAKRKGKLPTTEIDELVASIIAGVITDRLEKYDQTVQDDLAIVKQTWPTVRPADQHEATASTPTDQLRRCYAAVVRLGEKRILKAVARNISETPIVKKRKADEDTEQGKKRSR